MKKNSISVIFLTLGIIWLFGGLLLYPDSGIWPLGVIFLIVGMIIKIGAVKL
ncbi:hypothetical protein [Psychroserpens sp.]|uniref:hypothetical protein n=1 Tax=Psychroserpens sp. TaxID=2020870 RepID=UPI001B0602B5|nr:hypothetical protein [Psychroserpens sp.]MBO6607493.1 hypothetical protein [Psychroserpens sp.]MBO6632713.1 hypothetical protein [Psychroserpens sp.]MBO6654429.1 hypothetical protein [Psychroserpens sp.]MBO6681222.1 hypothetical protein [Psychroserpens sp.]MBO6749821.1 hypothetical protein [Psychroserpens sp.]